MRRVDFHFELPPELIAQHPAPSRDASRLLVVSRPTGAVTHQQFSDFPSLLRPGDLLCLNDTKVLHARLRGTKIPTGGAVEVLLLSAVGENDWWAMLRPGRRLPPGARFQLNDNEGNPVSWEGCVLEKNDAGHFRVQFSGVGNILDILDQIGEVPLPPYIERKGKRHSQEDRERYQTVFAQHRGSVAAPTAGLHFTGEMLERIRQAGVEIHSVTLHVGAGTFAPMKADDLAAHVMHEEVFEIPASTAEAINRAHAEGRRVVAIGTTTCRVLESAARWVRGAEPTVFMEPSVVPRAADVVCAGRGRTRLFLHPPALFHVVGALFTNFHLPESTLLMLVSAFAMPGELDGRERVLNAYAEAVRERYRFFSYGDAMFLQ